MPPCPAPRTPHRRIRTVVTATVLLMCALPPAAAVAAGEAAPAPAGAPRAATRHTADVKSVDLRMKDGVVLKGTVATPAPGTPGADRHGRYPAVVLPSSWGVNDKTHLAQVRSLAADGYVVVAYTPRGFWLSGGEVDVAGPKDVADITTVIDWTLEHTPADPDRLGMTGVSLGGGLTLMGAAFDSRVKAVAAMSGWGDLSGSLRSGDTRHMQAVAALYGVEKLTGRASDELERMITAHLSDRDSAEVTRWAKVRSPATYIDRINANGTAVFLGNSWGDSIFHPSQIIDFHRRLTVPKRLELRPGEHATTEITSFLGLPNGVWASARRWLDHHLKGIRNGIDREGGVMLEVRRSGAREEDTRWQDVSSRSEQLVLGAADGWPRTGELGGNPRTGRPTRIVGGFDSGANGGVVIASGLLDQIAELPPVVSVPLLPRAFGAVWQSERYPSGLRIRGIPELQTTVTSSAPAGTAIAYLYDVDSLGTGKLITHAPQSWSDRTPGEPFRLDIKLFAKVSFGASEQDQARLTVPVR